MPKHVEAKCQKEYTDCRIVHFLLLPEFQYISQCTEWTIYLWVCHGFPPPFLAIGIHTAFHGMLEFRGQQKCIYIIIKSVNTILIMFGSKLWRVCKISKKRFEASSCLPVRPSIRLSSSNNLVFTGRIFMKCGVSRFFRKSSEKIWQE